MKYEPEFTKIGDTKRMKKMGKSFENKEPNMTKIKITQKRMKKKNNK